MIAHSIGHVKVIEILKPHVAPNIHSYTIVKCELFIHEYDNIRLIKYFRPCDLEEDK
jgi:hypothetical protein